MKNIFSRVHFYFFITGLFSLAGKVLAADTGAITPQVGGGNGLSYKLANPLAFNTLQDFIVAILNVIVIIATPIVVVFIILSGFKYVTAQGNPAEIEKATKSLTYAVIGGVLILGAVAIAQIIKNLVTAFSA
jgi:hypothetical protein